MLVALQRAWTNDWTARFGLWPLSTGMSYLEAHKICADAGRRPRRVMRPSAVHAVYANHEEASWVSFLDRRPAMRPTVAQLVRDLSAGRYIFKVKGHVFAVVDGVCLDVFPKPAPRRRVEGYWTMKAVAAPKALFNAPASSPQQLELALHSAGSRPSTHANVLGVTW